MSNVADNRPEPAARSAAGEGPCSSAGLGGVLGSIFSSAAPARSLNRRLDYSFGFRVLNVLSHIGHSGLPALRECYGNFVHTNPIIKDPGPGHLVRQPEQVCFIGGEDIRLSG